MKKKNVNVSEIHKEYMTIRICKCSSYRSRQSRKRCLHCGRTQSILRNKKEEWNVSEIYDSKWQYTDECCNNLFLPELVLAPEWDHP